MGHRTLKQREHNLKKFKGQSSVEILAAFIATAITAAVIYAIVLKHLHLIKNT